ncbi:MAG TPA: IPT/TIG domain-containing protein [Bryobacteraceae bacterium]|nr:IPT/TIG domain-containing protein [Bryobacteraceae bacterium]
MHRSPAYLTASWLYAISLAAQVNVLTFKNDNARTGQNLNEPLLSPSNVNPTQFGRRFSHVVDGYMYGQPLYMASVPMADGTVHNIIVAGTAHDSVYAFDADDALGSNASPLWQVSFINPSQGVTTVSWQDVNCTVIYPEIGITGTPVIDAASYTVYLVAFTKETASDGSVRYVHRLHALDVRSGKELAASPVEIQASVPGIGDGSSTVSFVPLSYKQRGALLLANGVVYTPWSSHCDNGLYHGWIMGYRADTLQQAAVYNSTPNGAGASFWGAGAGPAADGDGNLFVVSANGTFDQTYSTPDLGDSLIKLSPTNGLTIADYFTPYNQLYLAENDLDLGSAGALLLPPEAGSNTHRNLALTAGKEGRIYLVDRDNMGRFNGQYDAGALQTITLGGDGVFGSAAYFSGRVYFSAGGDGLRAFGIANAALTPAPVSSSPKAIADPGTTPVVSANGSANGIVWAYELGEARDTLLHAYDATDLSKELYLDVLNAYTEFGVPMVADGKVYVGALNNLLVYGLLPPAAGSAAAVVNAASFNSQIAAGSLISIFGSNLAHAVAGALQIPLPISLADTTVSVNGVRVPLLYVSPGQINAQVPPQTAAGTASVTVVTSSSAAPAISFQVAAAAPQIFVRGTRVVALNQDGSVNSMANPAAAGSIVTIFLTGHGALNAQGALVTPTASIGGLSAKLTYAGPAPQTVGVAQMNIVAPALDPGDYPLQVTIAGVASNSGLLSVK